MIDTLNAATKKKYPNSAEARESVVLLEQHWGPEEDLLFNTSHMECLANVLDVSALRIAAPEVCVVAGQLCILV